MKNDKLKYYFLYLFGILNLTLTIIFTKKMVKLYNIPHMEVLFFRELIITIFLIPFMIKDRFNPFKASAFSLQISRHSLFAFSAYLWYFGMMVGPVNEIMTMSFLTPVIAIILSNRILKEKTDMKLWISLIVGFLGIIVMQYNKMSIENILGKNNNFILITGYLASMSAILLRGYIPILNKKLASKSSISEMNYMSHIIFTLVAFMFFPGFKKIPLSAIFYLSICCITFFIEYYAVSVVYKKLTITKIQPFDFSKIIFSAVFSYLILGESFTCNQFIGILIIILSYFISKK